jgi:hypothetical protein
MDVGTPFLADRQPPKLAEPGQGALHDQPRPPQPGAAVDATACNPRLDATAGQGPAAAAVIVGLVGVQLAGSLSGPALGLPDSRYGIDDLL